MASVPSDAATTLPPNVLTKSSPLSRTQDERGVRNVDDPEIAAPFRSAEGDPWALFARAILAWVSENLLHLGLRDVMPVD
jgi:hypothetical protein